MTGVTTRRKYCVKCDRSHNSRDSEMTVCFCSIVYGCLMACMFGFTARKHRRSSLYPYSFVQYFSQERLQVSSVCLFTKNTVHRHLSRTLTGVSVLISARFLRVFHDKGVFIRACLWLHMCFCALFTESFRRKLCSFVIGRDDHRTAWCLVDRVIPLPFDTERSSNVSISSCDPASFSWR